MFLQHIRHQILVAHIETCLIYNWLVDNLLGSSGVPQCTQCLRVVALSRTDSCNNTEHLTIHGHHLLAAGLAFFKLRGVNADRSHSVWHISNWNGQVLTGNHDSLGVSTEAVFEQPREQGVAIRNEDTASIQCAASTGQLRCSSHTHGSRLLARKM